MQSGIFFRAATGSALFACAEKHFLPLPGRKFLIIFYFTNSIFFCFFVTYLTTRPMKKFSYVLISAAIVLFAFTNMGCKKSSTSDSVDEGTPTSMGNIGNTFSGYIAGMKNFNGSITKNAGGVATIKCTGQFTDPTMKNLVTMLNSHSLMTVDPDSGTFSVELKVKFTSTGIVDYFASGGTGSRLADYNGSVGDVYTGKNAEGNTITREVTAKSSVDDYPYGFYYIKTMTIKETGSSRGITKVEYRVNHKFGLVNITIYLQDGTSYSFFPYSTNLNE
jgi:hypothetical protein